MNKNVDLIDEKVTFLGTKPAALLCFDTEPHCSDQQLLCLATTEGSVVLGSILNLFQCRLDKDIVFIFFSELFLCLPIKSVARGATI